MDYSKIEFHESIKISDYYGSIYNNAILDEIDEGFIVRLSLVVHDNYFDSWSHDSPYVIIVKKEMHIDDTIFVGEIYDFKREKNEKYPIPVGERVVFSRKNIIELPINIQKNLDEKRKLEISGFLTSEKITITGPLYTIKIQDDESDTNSTSGSDDSSCSDSSLTTYSEEDSYVSDSD